MAKIRISLNSLEGKAESYLEILKHPNGDIYVELKGQNERGEVYTVRGQIPNPINGGGNHEEYKKLANIFKNYKR